MFSASDLKKGLKVEVDGEPWAITEFEFCKPGKGTALYRCKLKNMITGSTMDRTYRPTDKLENRILKKRYVPIRMLKPTSMYSAMRKLMKKCMSAARPLAAMLTS
jgi:translation elongation factor P/translation initiation factor 5A